MLCEFDNFLERLERPLPEPKTTRVIDVAMSAQAACAGLTVSCAQFAVSSTVESVITYFPLK
jgi:hypothetical protein